MRRICSFVPATTVTGAAQSRPQAGVPSRARRKALSGENPMTLRVGALPAAPARPSAEPSS
jgi:hypothetical protein